MKKVIFIIILIFSNIYCPKTINAQESEKSNFKIGGLAFGDFYYVDQNHLEDAIGDKGFVLRRGYITFNTKINQNWFGRFRIEVNQSSEFETYTYKAEIKDFYIGYKAGKHGIIVGLSPTKTFDIIENIWGLRYLTRTPMDLQGIASRDWGLTVQGPISRDNTLSYRVMIGDGVDPVDFDNLGIKYMGALSLRPTKKWLIDFYLDYEKMTNNNLTSTVQLFAAYKTENLRWGIQYSNQYRQNEPRLELASTFIVSKIYKEISLIGRVDRLLEPSPKGNDIAYLPFDPTAKATFLVSGIEIPISNHFLVTPNITFTTYDKSSNGNKPNNDLLYRFTMFLNFE